MKVTADRARAHRLRIQGLAAPVARSPAEALERCGWVPIAGALDIRLALYARVAGLTRDAIDPLLDSGALRIAPAAGGRVHLVPEADLPLALRTAALLGRGRLEEAVARTTVAPARLDAIGDAMLDALGDRRMTVYGIEEALPDAITDALYALDPRPGAPAALRVALQRLELAGRIERRPRLGFFDFDWLDVERCTWIRPPTTVDMTRAPTEAQAVARALAARYFRWAGPATAADFTRWSGLDPQTAARGMAGVELAPVTLEGEAEAAWICPDRLDALRAAAPVGDVISLLDPGDPFLSLRGEPAPVGAADDGRPSRPLLLGGRSIGTWHMHAGPALAVPTATLSPKTTQAVRAAEDRLSQFILGEHFEDIRDDARARRSAPAPVQRAIAPTGDAIVDRFLAWLCDPRPRDDSTVVSPACIYRSGTRPDTIRVGLPSGRVVTADEMRSVAWTRQGDAIGITIGAMDDITGLGMVSRWIVTVVDDRIVRIAGRWLAPGVRLEDADLASLQRGWIAETEARAGELRAEAEQAAAALIRRFAVHGVAPVSGPRARRTALAALRASGARWRRPAFGPAQIFRLSGGWLFRSGWGGDDTSAIDVCDDGASGPWSCNVEDVLAALAEAGGPRREK